MGEVALRACPFCGFRDAAMIGPEPKPGLRIPSNATQDCFWVFCDNCLANGPIVSSKDDAIAAWNRRTPSPEALAALEGVMSSIGAHACKNGTQDEWCCHCHNWLAALRAVREELGGA